MLSDKDKGEEGLVLIGLLPYVVGKLCLWTILVYEWGVRWVTVDCWRLTGDGLGLSSDK